jgi:hypothetical protein
VTIPDIRHAGTRTTFDAVLPGRDRTPVPNASYPANRDPRPARGRAGVARRYPHPGGRVLIDEPEQGSPLDARASRAALARYGLDRFLADWDPLLEDEPCGSR